MSAVVPTSERRSHRVLRALAMVSVVGAVSLAAVWTGLRTPSGMESIDHAASMMVGGSFEPWHVIGSSGAVDDLDRDYYDSSGAVMAVRSSAPTAVTVNVRYPVHPVDGLINNRGCVLLIARFRDNGASAQIVARLKRYHVNTGSTTTLLTVNSNDYDASNSYQLGSEFDCNLTFDFFNYAYFVDVELRRTASGGRPVLGSLRLSTFVEQ